MTRMGEAMGAVVSRFPPSLVRRMAKQYTAGTTVADAMGYVADFADRGIATTMSVLGEAATTPEYAAHQVGEFTSSINAVASARRDYDVRFAVKITALGHHVSRELALANLLEVARAAAASGRLVEVDMEQAEHVDTTLSLVRKARSEVGNVGAVVQACLRRTQADVEGLIEDKIPTRVVKGAYKESPEVAFQNADEIRQQFGDRIAEYLSARVPVGIATHDDALIERALIQVRDQQVPAEAFEFQMLKGVQEELRSRLVAEGHTVRVVLNFGEDLHLWSIRRLQENPNIVKHVLRSNLRRSS